MIIGIHSRENDLEVNPVKGKQLTNVRTVLKDDAVKLVPVKKLTIEDAISFIGEDEMIEVTPLTFRLRKKLLNPSDRKKQQRNK